jgi:hypothetical protein
MDKGIVLLVCCCTLLVGCVSTTSNLYNPGVVHSPTNISNVAVYKTQPEFEFIKIGEITVDDCKDWSQAESALKREAAKIGADAVVVIDTQTSQRGGLVGGPSGLVGGITKRMAVTGIAIKRKEQ